MIMGCGSDGGPASAPQAAGAGGGTSAPGAGGGGASGAAGAVSVGGGAGAGGSDAAGAGGFAAGGAGASAGAGLGGSAGGSGKGGSAGGTGVGGFQTAKHTAFPVIPKFGGPVLASPQIVTITYAGYKFTPDVEAFGDFVVSSDWITAVGADYGFAQGTHLAKVQLPDAAPATMSDDELQMFIAAKLADGTLPKPAGNPNDYLYIFYFPKTTKFKRVDGAASCTTFLGFHNGYYSGPTRVAYAVIADCGAQPGVPELGVITSTASHELAEAASDPLPYNNPAFNFGSGNSMDPWHFWGSENGDICAGVDYKHPSGNWLQRSWSNANAKLSLDPCVPPAQADASVFSVSASPSTLQAVNPGQAVTFKLTGWSTKERADWSLSYSIWRADFLPKIALGATTINNGGTTDLTLTVPNAAPSGSLFLMTVESKSGTDVHPWPVAMFVP